MGRGGLHESMCGARELQRLKDWGWMPQAAVGCRLAAAVEWRVWLSHAARLRWSLARVRGREGPLIAAVIRLRVAGIWWVYWGAGTHFHVFVFCVLGLCVGYLGLLGSETGTWVCGDLE